MKGPSMYPNYRGNKPAQQAISVKKDGNPGVADGRAASSPFQLTDDKVKKVKTKEDYIKEGFTPADAAQMMKDGASTGKQAPTKFLGKLAKGIGKFAGGALKGKDGKFGIGDIGRLALGPAGAIAGGAGLFMKGKKSPTKMYGKKSPAKNAGSDQEVMTNKKSTDSVVNNKTKVVSSVGTERLIAAGAPKEVIAKSRAKFLAEQKNKKK